MTSVEILANRVTHLEAALKSLQQKLPLSAQADMLPPSLSIAHEQAMSSTNNKSDNLSKRGRPPKNKQSFNQFKPNDYQFKSQNSPQSIPYVSSAVSNDSEEEEAAMILEDFALGRKENAFNSSDKINLNSDSNSPIDRKSISPISFNNSLPSTSYSNSKSSQNQFNNLNSDNKRSQQFPPPDFFSISNLSSSHTYLKNVLSFLPDRSKSEALVNLYIKKVDFFHKTLHIPTLLKEVEHFWSISNSNYELIINEKLLPFLGLYIIILCVALHFADTEEAIQAGFTPEEHRNNPISYFKASRAALWGGDYLENHNLHNLQTIVLMGLYLNNTNASSTHFSLIGAAIKIAQNMGLSKLGPEENFELNQINSKKTVNMGIWKSVVNREVGRRIWWNLIMLDWFLAGPHNYTYTIHRK